MPGTNQPVDYDFINQLVNVVNNHTTSLNLTAATSTSSILEQQPLSNKLKTYGINIKIPASSSTANTLVAAPSPTFEGFSNTPIIIATPTANSSASGVGCTVIISGVTATTCNISVRWLETKTSGVDMSINLIAIGPTA
jgi:hypothetical protein